LHPSPTLHLDHPIYHVYYVYLAPPTRYTRSAPLLLHPIYRPHLSTTAQTIPALHLEHPIYHVYYVYLAPPS
ncbi:hypothetical protein, partial [uncultured Porphyromonas sp.]|uniref:hypothetical protein n=1 Tax=uncultured Porphyromonas sp. TaxID=159274 RepID=UPI0026264929